MHGIGVFSKSLNIAYAANVTTAESYDNPTINGCELLAIKKALMFLEKAPPGKYEIVSDSKFALSAIQKGRSTLPKLQFIITEIKQLLLKLAHSAFLIAFSKVKSHMWLDREHSIGNAMADMLAQFAATGQLLSPCVSAHLPKQGEESPFLCASCQSITKLPM